MSHAYTEDQLVEQPAIGLFASLGWQTTSAMEETFGTTGTLGRETKGEVVLVERLRGALTKLNPDLPPEAIQTAIDDLARDRSAMSLEAIVAATGFCATYGVDLVAMEALPLGGMERLSAIENAIDAMISPDDRRREFFGHDKYVGILYRAVKPDPAAVEFSVRVAGIATLAGAIRAKLCPNPPDIATILQQIGVVLDESITGLTIREEGPPAINLAKINFEALAAQFKESKHKNTDLEVLKAAIAARLGKMLRLNRTRTDFTEKFEELIESYNSGSRNIEQLFEDLMKLSRSLDAEQERHVRENLSIEEQVIFDILTRPSPELSTAEREEVKKVARELLARLKQLLVLNWRQKSAARSTLKLAIEDTLDDGLPDAYSSEIYNQKCSALFEHVYESYPEQNTGVYAEVG